MFQSTRPRGRDHLAITIPPRCFSFNPHAREGVTATIDRGVRIADSFNPHAREGVTFSNCLVCDILVTVSIHTPARA